MAAAAAKEKGKKKVSPMQVAFIVERYLSDNRLACSLAAFRSEASHLFPRAKPKKEAPKGLLGLAEILDDYITLKEQRLAIDQERRRLETAMQGMRDVIWAYHSAGPAPLPSSPPLIPPQFVGSPAPPLPSAPPPPPPHRNHESPPGNAGYVSPVIHYRQSSIVLQNSSKTNNTSTPVINTLSTKKRKAAKSAVKIPPAPKRPATVPPSGHTAYSQPSVNNPDEKLEFAVQPGSAEQSVQMNLPSQGSSVPKSLFKPPESQGNHSPQTNQQAHPSEGDASNQIARPAPVIANANAIAPQEIASSQCSIVSSQTLIVSPLKGAAYYSVERTYHVTSPFKSSMQKSSKREHVKGRLDFDCSDGTESPNEQITEMASSSSDGEKQDPFDFDISDFDIFEGDLSFSDLLDLDLDTEGAPLLNPCNIAEVQRLEPIAESDCVMVDQVLPDCSKSMMADHTEDAGTQASAVSNSVTSVRAITKRIKMVSPVKGRTS